MARKSGFVRRHGVMRRESLWLVNPFTTVTLASTNAVAMIASLNAAALALRPFTIVRTRGMAYVSSDQVAASEIYSVSMGYAVVSDQAVAIGVTAVPTPDTDRGSDLFFVFEDFFGRFEFITGTGTQERGFSRGYDSKAMRKVEQGQDLAQTIECPSTSGIYSEAARILIKLH